MRRSHGFDDVFNILGSFLLSAGIVTAVVGASITASAAMVGGEGWTVLALQGLCAVFGGLVSAGGGIATIIIR